MHRVILHKSVPFLLTIVTLSCGNAEPAGKHSTDTATDTATHVATDTAKSTDTPPVPVQHRASQSDSTATGILFSREHVVATVQEDGKTVEINGRYDFVNFNDTERMQRLYFPFAINRTQLRPRLADIHVTNIPPYRPIKDGILFSLQLDAHAKKTVSIAYRQSTLDSAFAYIMTSALSWQRNSDEAVFELLLPNQFQLSACSFPVKKEPSSSKHASRYVYRVTGFQPQTDFTFSWKKE